MEIGMFQTDRRVDRDFYIMGWCAAGIFAALFLFVRVTGIPVWKFLPVSCADRSVLSGVRRDKSRQGAACRQMAALLCAASVRAVCCAA